MMNEDETATSRPNELRDSSQQCSTHSTCVQMEKYLELFSKNNGVGIENSPNDVKRALLLKHADLVQDFEKEKRQTLISFEEEKQLLKNAFENERKEYEMELEAVRKRVVELLNELEGKYEKEIKDRNAIQREMLEKERLALKRSVQEQMNLIADVENEIKRILRRLIIELNESACEKLEVDLCNPEFVINSSCLIWLKQIFDENREKRDLIDRNKSCHHHNQRMSQFEFEKDELHEVGEVFRKQKKELTEIFLKEKKSLEEKMKYDLLEHKKKLDKEYEERVQAETQVWQETIKDYEREIAILRYERQQMDRNYCIEIDKLKLETEKEKVEICTKYMKEKEQLRRKLSDRVNDNMLRNIRTNQITSSELEKVHVSKQ